MQGNIETIKSQSIKYEIPVGRAQSLLWDTDQVTQDIGINDFEILYVILSEARDRVLSRQENYHALVATPQMVRVKDNPYSIRAQDAMGIGDFYIEIVIVPKSGDSIKCVFCIHVTDNWHQLSMEMMITLIFPIVIQCLLTRCRCYLPWILANLTYFALSSRAHYLPSYAGT